MNRRKQSAPEEPPRPVVVKKEGVKQLYTILAVFICFLILSCSSSRYILTESIQSQNLSNLPPDAAFAQLIRLTIVKMNEMNGKDLIRALDDAASIQTSDTLPNLAYTKISQYAAQELRSEDRKQIVTLLLDFMSFRYNEVKRLLQNSTPEMLIRNGAMTSIQVMSLRLGNTNAKMQANNNSRNYITDALAPIRRRAIDYHKILQGNPALSLLTSVHSQSELTMNESKQILPVYLESGNFNILRYILSHADDFLLDSEMALTVIKDYISQDSISQADSLAYAYVSSLQSTSDETLNILANLVCANELRTCAKALTRLITDSTPVSGACLHKIGWYVYSVSPDSTKRIWQVALTKLDTSTFDYKSTAAYLSVIEGNDSLSRSLLRSLILEYPQTVLPRKIYLDFLLDDFDHTKLSNFLWHSKEALDSVVFHEHFGEINMKTVLAGLFDFYSWQNSKGVKYWVYKDTTNTSWLYDRNFEPLNTSVFVNKNNDIMFWVFEDGKEYLFNEDNTYANQYRFPNSEGKFVNAIIKDGYTYYYDEEYEWTGYKSYTNKDGKDIYVKTTSNYEYFYDDNLDYMSIYSYRTSEGKKMFVEERGLLEIYHDSIWVPTGLIGFSNNQALYAFVYSDNVKLYSSNEHSGLSSLNVAIYKNDRNQIYIEDGDAFRYYYSVNGDYLNWRVWMNEGKIVSISVPYKGECKQLSSGVLSDCSSYDNQKSNLYSQKKYLNRTMITEIAALFSGQTETPYEIFTSIASEIEKRKRQEVALAILQGINQGLESYNKSMQSYNSRTYSNPYSTYTSNYSSNSTYSTNSYQKYSNSYSNTLSNSYSYDSYTPTQKAKYFSYSDSYGTNLSGSSRSIGRFNYTDVSGNNGYSGSATSYNIGKFNYTDYSDNKGTYGHGTSYSIGKTQYYDYSDNKGNSMSGDSRRIGNFEYFSGRDNNMNSYSGTSQKIGNFIYHDMTTSDGKRASGTTYKIGNTTYTDWNISQ